MLDLDSPRWSKLEHAYGCASDIPGYLRAIKKVPYSGDDGCPWQALYSSLCHQFQLGTASYAAFPHVIAMAEASCGKSRLEFLDLASTIEAERHMPYQPAFPRGLKTAYMEALGRAPALAEELLSEKWSEEQMRALLGAIAVFRGHARLGFSLVLWWRDEMECEECGHVQMPPYYGEFER